MQQCFEEKKCIGFIVCGRGRNELSDSANNLEHAARRYGIQNIPICARIGIWLT